MLALGSVRSLGVLRPVPAASCAPIAARSVARVTAARSSNGREAVEALERFSADVQTGLTAGHARKHPRILAAQVDTVSVEEGSGGSAASVDDEPTAANLQELQQDTFWPFLEAAGEDLVVVDFYTDWCGPCKMIYPDLVKLSGELKPHGVSLVKFNCNKNNKELGKTLGIKVAPTFHLYRKSEKVGEMTGAKVAKLCTLINDQQVASGKPAIQFSS